MISFVGSALNDGNNTILFQATQFPENTPTNRFDEFHIKDMLCFFNQRA